MSLESIKKACDAVGGVSRLSNILGVKPPSVQQWLNGRRPIPAERCPDIERATGGKVRCEDLRPDLMKMWEYLRGAPGSAERGDDSRSRPRPLPACGQGVKSGCLTDGPDSTGAQAAIVGATRDGGKRTAADLQGVA